MGLLFFAVYVSSELLLSIVGYLYIELPAFRFNHRVLNIFDKSTSRFKLIVQLSNTI